MESMFGMARRFPSIRLTSAEKKRAKKALNGGSKEYENFPRCEGGERVPMSFGGTLEGLYSKPDKNGGSKPGSGGSRVRP